MERSVTEPKPEPEKPPPVGWKWKFTLLGLIGVFVALAAYDLVSVSGQVGTAGSARASGTPAATHALGRRPVFRRTACHRGADAEPGAAAAARGVDRRIRPHRACRR
jgi:hypothetical protein